MVGILDYDIVMVNDQTEGNRLYGRGNYGYPRKGGIDLDLVEATYLVECKRLEVESEGETMTFDELFRHSASVLDGFDIKYMVYRDLRQRGFVVKPETGAYDLSVLPRGKMLSNSRPEFYVSAVSERNPVDISQFIEQLSQLNKKGKRLLYGVVDGDGDTVYYEMFIRDPSGETFPESVPGKALGWLIRDRVFVFDMEDSEILREYGFYGNMMNDSKQLSLVESCHLIGKGKLKVLGPDEEELDFNDLREFGESLQKDFSKRLMIYSDLRERGLVVKTGFKYGTDFRAYVKSPDDCHARYLTHTVTEDDLKTWPDISRTVRLSTGVKKEILFGRVVKNTIQYLEFKWFRP